MRADPAYLKPVLERFRTTPFVLLHCYPYVREAGWLAHVYANVYFDLSLTIPHVARGAEALREALELAPVSKLLYASDAALAPELYFLGAKRWREALAEVLPELLPPAQPVREPASESDSDPTRNAEDETQGGACFALTEVERAHEK